LGDGRTRAVWREMDSKDAGESEYMPGAERADASTARLDAAKAFAEASRQGYGSTDAPLATAISTAVEKDRASTITTALLIGASVTSPCRPHSQFSSSIGYNFTSKESSAIMRSSTACALSRFATVSAISLRRLSRRVS